jgi:Ca2+/Na+ antiporter
MFFVSSFVALAATFTLLGFIIRLWFHKDELYLDHVSVSTRQGFLLTLCALGAMFLKLLESLTWWSGLLLIVIALLIELYISRSSE